MGFWVFGSFKGDFGKIEHWFLDKIEIMAILKEKTTENSEKIQNNSIGEEKRRKRRKEKKKRENSPEKSTINKKQKN